MRGFRFEPEARGLAEVRSRVVPMVRRKKCFLSATVKYRLTVADGKASWRGFMKKSSLPCSGERGAF